MAPLTAEDAPERLAEILVRQLARILDDFGGEGPEKLQQQLELVNSILTDACQLSDLPLFPASPSSRESWLAARLAVVRGPPVVVHLGFPLRHHRPSAGWLVMIGGRKLLKHSPIVMTERYAHLAPERVRSAAAMLDEVTKGSRFSHARLVAAAG